MKISAGIILAFFLTSACHALDVKDPSLKHKIPKFTIPEMEEGKQYEYVFALGDMGTGREDQKLVAKVMARRAREVDLDFMITLGDNFYPIGVEGAKDPQFKTKFENVYKAKSLAVPIYPSLGNHDHLGNPEAQVKYSKRNPLWKMPARYYTFSVFLDGDTEVAFFAIDTTPLTGSDLKKEGKKQLRWLERELSNSDADWKIVYGHHPMYTHGGHPPDKNLRGAVQPLLRQNQVDLFLAGHNHSLEVLKPKGGVLHVVAGAAGGPDKAYKTSWEDDTVYTATKGGVLLMRLGAENLVLEFIRMDGSTQYAHVLTKEDN